MSSAVIVSQFSDLLCVWAYVSQVRVDELRAQFGAQVTVHSRFCAVFSDVETKLVKGWRDRGGVAGYRAHVEHIIGGFDHVTLHADTWSRVVPTTSASAHACVKAVELAVASGECRDPSAEPGSSSLADAFAWALRLAFFRDGRDVSRLEEQLAVAQTLEIPAASIRRRLEDGSAWARVLHDYEEASAGHVRGSPTFVLNEARQMLYGNVSYGIIVANVHELLRNPGDRASWC